MSILEALSSKENIIAAGLMSGTSVDGIDAALIKIKAEEEDFSIKLIDFLTYPYPPALKMQINLLIESRISELKNIAYLNFKVGEIFADALIELSKKADIPLKEIDFIGSHGQTIWHSPPEKGRHGSTLQIGDGDVIKEKTGIITVSDFRISDMAVGGEGAPFVPFVDFLLFKDLNESRGLLNIGGISNITALPKQAAIDDVIAFDCGPGNTLIDIATQLLFNKEYDENGLLASEGTVHETLLDEMMSHPFIRKEPPKSTGRETFDIDYCRKIIQKGKQLNLSGHDIIATISEFTVKSIYSNYINFISPRTTLDRIIISGGGVFNAFILNSLKNHFKDIVVESSEKYLIPPEAKEAVAFAVLAHQTLSGKPANLPSVTGAAKKVVCGKISIIET